MLEDKIAGRKVEYQADTGAGVTTISTLLWNKLSCGQSFDGLYARWQYRTRVPSCFEMRLSLDAIPSGDFIQRGTSVGVLIPVSNMHIVPDLFEDQSVTESYYSFEPFGLP